MGSSDRVVIVTGGSRGQGEAEARLLANRGAKVVIGDVLVEEGKAVADSLGDAAIYRHLDVTSETEWTAAVEATLDWVGRIDALVNNAGVVTTAPLEETDLETYRRVVDVNQIGVFLGMRAVVPHMKERGGAIVNVSSAAAVAGVPGMTAYCAGKWAVRGMTKVAAVELGRYGIRVNTVLPGGVDTPMVRSSGLTDEQIRDAWSRNSPLMRIGQPSEIAEVVAFLASEAASFVTGADWLVDGGRTAGVSSPLFDSE